MILKVLEYPNLLLTQKCKPVEIFNIKELTDITKNMIETMRAYSAIGLAANQVGINKRIFVMEIQGNIKVFINPEFTVINEEKIFNKEGCLSFPKLAQEVLRYPNIEVSYQTVEGELIKETFSELEAICVQHEIDHLNGITFIDYLKPVKKQMTIKKYLKNLKTNKDK